MKTLIKLSYLFIIASLISQLGCKKENAYFFDEPVMNPVSAPDLYKQERGKSVEISIELQAISGLDIFEVYKGDSLYDSKTFDKGELQYTYDFLWVVSEHLTDSTEIDFTFKLRDKDGRYATEYVLIVIVLSPFSISDFEFGGYTLKRVEGRINTDYTFAAVDKYLIDETVVLEGGITLTIEKGSTVYFRTYDDDTESRLIITRGNKIHAEGTKDEPIVFTSDRVLTGNADIGDWGALIVYGYAPTNEGNEVAGSSGYLYGGTKENDDSGVLKYVRVEWAGKDKGNSLNLYGVGSKTVIDYVEIYRGWDISVRVKGGNVNIKHLVCMGHHSYGLWAEYGWKGNGQFWVMQTDIAATIVPVNYFNQARSVELRNDKANFLAEPATYVYLSNITVIGNGNQIEDGTRRGVRVRRGAMARIHNVIATNFADDGFRVEDVEDVLLYDGIIDVNGSMDVGHIRAYSNRTNYSEQAESYFYLLDSVGNDMSTNPVSGVDALHFVGSEPSTFDPKVEYDSWFVSAPFIGGIENAANDWTADGEWCKDMEGNIR